MRMTTEDRIRKAHIALMRHPETALYSGVLMMGVSEVTDTMVTAYTDGVNKKYGRAFMDSLSDPEVTALVLHENLHIVFRHLLHNRDLFEEDRSTANKAADYVVNDVIVSLKDKNLCKLPKGALVDAQYHNMNMREVYRLLREQKQQQQKNSGSPDGEPKDGAGNDGDDGGGGYEFDEHDTNGETSAKNVEDVKGLDARIDRALREGALLAGRLGSKIPRAVSELLQPKTRWQDELREFVSAATKGKDEYTWRKFNRRMLPNDIYLPSVENETIGEVVVAIDTSGSISDEQLSEFATELVSICDSCSPEALRILWWDTMVHGEQVFRDNYSGLEKMLKPQGGGGTRVACVAEYIEEAKIKAECVIVFTDGYVENSPKWSIPTPTLWLVTLNKEWTPPVGRKVVFES